MDSANMSLKTRILLTKPLKKAESCRNEVMKITRRLQVTWK